MTWVVIVDLCKSVSLSLIVGSLNICGLPCSRYGVAGGAKTDNKDGIMESPVNFKSFEATLSGTEALSALNLAIKLTILSYDAFMLTT